MHKIYYSLLFVLVCGLRGSLLLAIPDWRRQKAYPVVRIDQRSSMVKSLITLKCPKLLKMDNYFCYFWQHHRPLSPFSKSRFLYWNYNSSLVENWTSYYDAACLLCFNTQPEVIISQSSAVSSSVVSMRRNWIDYKSNLLYTIYICLNCSVVDSLIMTLHAF